MCLVARGWSVTCPSHCWELRFVRVEMMSIQHCCWYICWQIVRKSLKSLVDALDVCRECLHILGITWFTALVPAFLKIAMTPCFSEKLGLSEIKSSVRIPASTISLSVIHPPSSRLRMKKNLTTDCGNAPWEVDMKKWSEHEQAKMTWSIVISYHFSSFRFRLRVIVTLSVNSEEAETSDICRRDEGSRWQRRSY